MISDYLAERPPRDAQTIAVTYNGIAYGMKVGLSGEYRQLRVRDMEMWAINDLNLSNI